MKNTFKNIILFSFLLTVFGAQVLTAQEGAVGIGDTDPDEAKLVVRSAPGFDALYLNNPIRSASPGVGISLQNYSNTNGGSLQIGTTGIRIDSDDIDKPSGTLYLNYNYDGVVNIANGGGNVTLATGGGNVGIGTSSPNIDLAIGDTDTGLQQQGDGQLAVYTNNVERARFNSSGNLGIGTTSPSYKLDVIGNSRISSLQVGNSIDFPGAQGRLNVGDSGAGTAADFYNNSPSVGGSSVVTVRIRNDGNGGALQILEGWAGKPGGGDWANTSDRRAKKNINEYSEGLSEILKVRPVSYQYNERSGYNTEETYVGIIAQELQEIAPHMVSKNGEFLMVDGSAFTYMLINAVQEQDQIITDQQKEIDELKTRLDRIEALLKK